MKDLKVEHQYTSLRALQIYTIYRIVVAGFLLVLFQAKAGEVFLGQKSPILFHWSSVIYLCTSIGFYFINKNRSDIFRFLVEIQVFIDIVLLTLLMHASGGIATGLGMLMAVSVTTACLLVERTSSIVFAAIATAAVLGEAIYLNLSGQSPDDYITQAGLLGATFFATSLFALLTARRLKQSELEAELTSADLASMEKLNEKIIQFMKTGVIVVDEDHNVQFMNTAAWQLLEMPEHIEGQNLSIVNNELNAKVQQWKKTGHARSSFKQSPTGPKIDITLSQIDHRNDQSLIFLEDSTPMTQQAQNLKLASLGRLTASIAHEIRNPLGALSHAAQLIYESPDITEADKRLVDMVQKNAIRVNAIIENVMQLSQRRVSEPQSVNLSSFLKNICDELEKNNKEKLQLFVDINPEDLSVQFDISQLMQVVTNLSENGIRHSLSHTGRGSLSLIAGINFKTKRPFLDIIDKGEGIPPSVAENIFEPFFTTSATGTGLGLYVSKELCEANRAQLNFIPVPAGGSCFRISFARDDKHDTTSSAIN
ncbi:two-component system sensor histidine kinase NtrB [Pleionea mediterranea]|uniref:histidine kinase n=1 Tax=Pleionea mediterranea TaxID=523701 RepID=A0A316FBU7_9GAMM|nr:ATP-binding protein [Pleionea mediterranea]PWK44443.1 sensor protein PilS [Pleionea mediterranea]